VRTSASWGTGWKRSGGRGQVNGLNGLFSDLGSDGASYEFEATLRYASESRSLIVEEFWLSVHRGPLLKAELDGEDQPVAEVSIYRVVFG